MTKITTLNRRFINKTPMTNLSDIPGDVDEYYDSTVRPKVLERYENYFKKVIIKGKEIFNDDILIDITLDEIKEKVSYDDGDIDWDEDDWNSDTEAVQVTYFFHHTVTFSTDKDINFLKLKYPSNFTTDGFKCEELWFK